jgi:hypothetical protein
MFLWRLFCIYILIPTRPQGTRTEQAHKDFGVRSEGLYGGHRRLRTSSEIMRDS